MNKIIVLGIGVLLCWSCQNPEEPASQTTPAAPTEHHHHSDSGALVLNNGEKWVVNEEMKPFVSKGEELVNTYIRDSQTDYKVLAGELKEQNTQLIQSCTMTGKSHDELHKWLYPHLELVKELAQAPDADKAAGVTQKLEKSYREYHEHFQ